mgnify:CR=1 FL=1
MLEQEQEQSIKIGDKEWTNSGNGNHDNHKDNQKQKRQRKATLLGFRPK